MQIIMVTTCLALTLVCAPSVAPAADTAAKAVEVLHAELLFVMKQAKKLGYAGRYQRLAPTVAVSYDFPYISKVVVGRYWRSFTAEQKSQFIRAFSKLSIATYANRFDGYSGERFKTISGEELKRGHRLVKYCTYQSERRRDRTRLHSTSEQRSMAHHQCHRRRRQRSLLKKGRLHLLPQEKWFRGPTKETE